MLCLRIIILKVTLNSYRLIDLSHIISVVYSLCRTEFSMCVSIKSSLEELLVGLKIIFLNVTDNVLESLATFNMFSIHGQFVQDRIFHAWK